MNFPVSELRERYGIGKQAEINRRKHLNIVPKKVDGVYVVDSNQLSRLDELDEFLRSSPKAKMTDFQSTGSTKSTKSTRSNSPPVIMEATLSDESSELVRQEDDEQTDLLMLVESVARAISPPNPISHWEKLQWLVDNQIIISTSEVEALVGTKPKRDRWIRGSFIFEKSGKLGTQTGWRVFKHN